MKARPTMYMLAGPNGAGKSTLYALRIQPVIKDPFINADLIQRDELQDPSMQAAYRAAEIAELRRRQCLLDGRSFVSESTFSHESKLQLVEEARAAGFRVVMYHVHVRSPELSVKRVEQRTKEGGHDVPEDKIRERYERNQALIRKAVLMADRAFVYDNSSYNKAPERAIDFKDGQVIRVSERVPGWARELYATELEMFSPARLNPAAASFADAKAIVARIGGHEAELLIPNPEKTPLLRGEIVGESAEHWIQQLDSRTYVAHFKTAFRGGLALHSTYDIAYPQRGRAVAELWVAERPARAIAFEAVMNKTQTRENALKQHPELRAVFSELTVAKLKFAQSPAGLAEVRNRLQADLDRGEIPQSPARKSPTRQR